MGLPVSISGSASSSASSGPSKSGDISGGTAFNIGGINLGTQYPTAATAGGGTPATQSLVGSAFGPYTIPLIVGGVAIVALLLVLRK